MRRRRLVRALSTSTVVLSALLAGCAPLLAADPRYATDSGARPQGQPTTENRAGGPPAIEAPKNDLSWRDCTSRVFSDAAVQPLPGVKLDCASYDADLDSINGAAGTVSIGVVRATSVQTPADKPNGYGVGLLGVFCVWLAVVAALYPLCNWFAGIKKRRSDWWLSYL